MQWTLYGGSLFRWGSAPTTRAAAAAPWVTSTRCSGLAPGLAPHLELHTLVEYPVTNPCLPGLRIPGSPLAAVFLGTSKTR